ncbi:hypothetical protein A6R68_02022, partial [Neotoma lepida]
CPHLKCFYNSRANVSCVWSQEEVLQVTSCHIHATSNTRFWNKTCELFPVRQVSWACNLILGSPDSQSLTAADTVNLSVVCWEGKGWRRVKTCKFRPFDNHLEFEARTRSLGHSWMDAPLLSLRQRQQWIYLEKLTPDTSYELQVRVRAKRDGHRIWSPWSQPLAFRTRPAGHRKEILPLAWLRHLLLSLGCVFGFLVCVYILIKCQYLGPWLKTTLKCHVPDPSEFFSQLSSQHGGDLQKWLSSPFPSSSFSPTGPAPEISPLEVLDRDTKAMQLFLLQQDTAPSPSPSGHSQGSCFTNQGYFFFHLPNALEIESCQVYFTYDPCVEEDVEADGPGLPEGSSLPSLVPLAGEEDDYCDFPPRDDLLLFSPSLSSPNTAFGGAVAPEEKPPLSLQEGLPFLPSPDLMGLQCPLELVLEGDSEGLSAHSSGEQASIPEDSPCGQDQDKALASVLPLNTDAYLSLQELQAQDPAHLV